MPGEARFALHHDDSAQRYTLLDGGQPSTFADYRLVADGEILLFHHTFTPFDQRNQGRAAELISRALDDVRASGRRVRATCWFVAAYLDSHPEYADLRA